jgi:hypothetical protein
MEREDNPENNIERLLDDLELKYLRLFERNRTAYYREIIKDIQKLRVDMGCRSITTDTKQIQRMLWWQVRDDQNIS